MSRPTIKLVRGHLETALMRSDPEQNPEWTKSWIWTFSNSVFSRYFAVFFSGFCRDTGFSFWNRCFYCDTDACFRDVAVMPKRSCAQFSSYKLFSVRRIVSLQNASETHTKHVICCCRTNFIVMWVCVVSLLVCINFYVYIDEKVVPAQNSN